MAKMSERDRVRQDPSGTKRRWGKRELFFLIAALISVGGAVVFSRMGNTGHPVAGKPLGSVPMVASSKTALRH
jgi:uncharacterized membrane protein